MTNWQLWEGLDPEVLGKLAMFQWNKYGLKVEFLTEKQEPAVFVEDTEEIGKLIRQAPSRSRGKE